MSERMTDGENGENKNDAVHSYEQDEISQESDDLNEAGEMKREKMIHIEMIDRRLPERSMLRAERGWRQHPMTTCVIIAVTALDRSRLLVADDDDRLRIFYRSEINEEDRRRSVLVCAVDVLSISLTNIIVASV